MGKIVLVILFFCSSFAGFSQAITRMKISSITSSENTGQVYTPWLNDNLDSLVESVWGNNSKWVDVKLTLEKRCKISKLSLYDFEGTFTDNPASIYGLNGTTKTLLGVFEGLKYKQFVDIIVSNPLEIDAIVIHKYSNNIPQKVQVYGTEVASPQSSPPPSSSTNSSPPQSVKDSLVKITEIKVGENTGQVYSPWLNDDLNSLVGSVWNDNIKWVEIRLKFEKRIKLTKLSFYDYEGTFTDNPASIYALDGNKRIFLGKFEGLTYKQFVDLVISTPFDADALIIHKFGNNIPQKIKVYGNAATTTASSPLGDVVSLSTPPIETSPVIIGTKIPIEGKRWYQLNNTNNNLEGLSDGIVGVNIEPSWGKILPNWNAYYPLESDEAMTLQSIRFHDGLGSYVNQPMTLSIITDKWERITVAKFTGESYNEWVGPDPTNPKSFVLKTPPTAKIKYLLINTFGNYPTEIELYGTYTASTKTLADAPNKTIKMKQGLGVNGFEWDFFSQSKIDENKFKAIKSFGGFRHYIDWDKLEATEGNYTFNPTFNGGWNYDAIYERCKLEGIEVLACIQTAPDWLINTYPEADRDNNISPVKYGKSVEIPTSYIEQARVAFQFAARYGSNPNVDKSLVSVYSKPRWTHDNVNSVKIGLDVVKYIECGNERDKWWRGRNAYQTAREHAANLSAFYDGHKNTMGKGVGVKNADPNMMVVMAGLSTANPDYVKGMVDWCKEFRGYKADSTVDLCWDVVNYHLYADNGNSAQDGTSTRGAAPEVSNAGKTAKDFVQMAHKYLNDMPVWITELGYDLNQGSPLKAIPIANKSEYITQADWSLRSSLMYNRLGIERSFFYELYDDNFENPIQFGSSGLINQNLSRRPAADYIYQTNKLMGDYVYKETISQDPLVDRYELNGKSAYVLVVPDEKARTTQYKLDLPRIPKATIYIPKIGADAMREEAVLSIEGKFSLTVTETPIFLIPTEISATKKQTTETLNVDGISNDFKMSKTDNEPQPLLSTLKTYPNPVADYLFLTLENSSTEKVEVTICDAVLGRILFHDTIVKTEPTFATKLDIRHLAVGSYIIEVIQGKYQLIKKIIKID